MVATLNHLKEQSRPILDRLGEDLKEIALVIEINQNAQVLNHIQIFLHLNRSRLEAPSHISIVRFGYTKKFYTAFLSILKNKNKNKNKKKFRV